MTFYVIHTEENDIYIKTESMIPNNLPNITILTEEEYNRAIFNILGTNEIEVFE